MKKMVNEKRFIYVNDLIERIKKRLKNEMIIGWLCSIVDEVPTVDAVEVVHGRWIEKPYLLGTTRYCSICGQNYGMPHGVFNYCPNCGAKMDGGNEDS